jgi:hypothetical protein
MVRCTFILNLCYICYFYTLMPIYVCSKYMHTDFVISLVLISISVTIIITFILIYIYIYKCICIYIYIHLYIYLYKCIHIYVHIYICIHIYIWYIYKHIFIRIFHHQALNGISLCYYQPMYKLILLLADTLITSSLSS